MTPHIRNLLNQADDYTGKYIGRGADLVALLAQALREVIEGQFRDQRNNPRPKVERRGRKKAMA